MSITKTAQSINGEDRRIDQYPELMPAQTRGLWMGAGRQHRTQGAIVRPQSRSMSEFLLIMAGNTEPMVCGHRPPGEIPGTPLTEMNTRYRVLCQQLWPVMMDSLAGSLSARMMGRLASGKS